MGSLFGTGRSVRNQIVLGVIWMSVAWLSFGQVVVHQVEEVNAGRGTEVAQLTNTAISALGGTGSLILLGVLAYIVGSLASYFFGLVLMGSKITNALTEEDRVVENLGSLIFPEHVGDNFAFEASSEYNQKRHTQLLVHAQDTAFQTAIIFSLFMASVVLAIRLSWWWLPLTGVMILMTLLGLVATTAYAEMVVEFMDEIGSEAAETSPDEDSLTNDRTTTPPAEESTGTHSMDVAGASPDLSGGGEVN